MKILYLCNEYYGSRVHANLCRALAALGAELQVYTYMTDPAKSGCNAFESDRVRFYYRPILRRWHRFVYHLKVRRVCDDLLQTVDAQAVDLILATTTFTDGAVARRAACRLGVPFVVMARNTDVNTFLRNMPHTWPEGRRIVREAARVLCISPQIERRFRTAWQLRGTGLEQKIDIQPNGIDDYWIDHRTAEPAECSHRLLYVGVFDVNKNVARLCANVLRLRDRYPDIQLGLVGGGGRMSRRVARYVQEYPSQFVYYGKITDKQRLQEIYRQHALFAMPSIHETFGLVYLEAMSQNLPVIYTRGQGIDGLFPAGIGEGVDAFSDRQIQSAIVRIFDHPEQYCPASSVDFDQFRWPAIAERYVEVVSEIVNCE